MSSAAPHRAPGMAASEAGPGLGVFDAADAEP